MQRRSIVLAALVVLVVRGSTVHAQSPTGDEPVVGGPCEGCRLVFVGMPEDFESRTRIAAQDEAGEPLRIEGRVVDATGDPVPGTIVYAYHTDAEGIYPGSESGGGRHGTLRGWAVADEAGRFVFETIRPASYPDSRVEQHVHMHVIEPGRCTYYVDALVFDDDPHFREGGHGTARGGPGVTSPRRGRDGVWVVEREIVLGRGVPGYPDPG